MNKAKGIVCKPMPREWHDRHAVNQIADSEKRKFYRDIVADKKPYFMQDMEATITKKHGMEKYMKFTMYEKESKDSKYRDNPYKLRGTV